MNKMKEFIKEEDGIGVVEIILILVILIGLVIIFKSQIEALVNKIFATITSKSQEVGIE
jgi:Flp pilus assembly pilin Flp